MLDIKIKTKKQKKKNAADVFVRHGQGYLVTGVFENFKKSEQQCLSLEFVILKKLEHHR